MLTECASANAIGTFYFGSYVLTIEKLWIPISSKNAPPLILKGGKGREGKAIRDSFLTAIPFFKWAYTA